MIKLMMEWNENTRQTNPVAVIMQNVKFIRPSTDHKGKTHVSFLDGTYILIDKPFEESVGITKKPPVVNTQGANQSAKTPLSDGVGEGPVSGGVKPLVNVEDTQHEG